MLFMQAVYQDKLPAMAAEFTSELIAVTEVLNVISEREEKKFVIYADLFSSVLALQ